MTTVQPSSTASTVMPDTQDQRADEPTALYRLYTADNTLLYIGITDDPDRRFKQHRDTKHWWPQVARTTIEWCSTRRRALAEEAAAIKAEVPVYNIDHSPVAQRLLVDPHQPPADMPADRLDALRQVASTLPADLGEAVLRAGVQGFADAQRERLVLEAEVWEDIEGGPDTFCVTTDEMACEPMSPARFLGMLPAARAKLDRMERMAREFEARDTLTAIITEHDLTLVEVDMGTVAEFAGDLANHLGCWSAKEDGRQIVWVPAGQDVQARTDAVAKLANHLAAQTEPA